jgi:hypothetical protein
MGAHTRCYGDEDLEDGSLGVAVADCRRNGWKPFLWVALGLISIKIAIELVSTHIVLILNNLLVV